MISLLSLEIFLSSIPWNVLPYSVFFSGIKIKKKNTVLFSIKYIFFLYRSKDYFRLRKINELLYFFDLRVRCPKAGRPQGVTG